MSSWITRVLVLSVICAGTARAQVNNPPPEGSFDPNFGGNGRKLIDVSSGPRDRGQVMHIQPDGKLLMGGTCGKSETSGGSTDIFNKFCATRLRPDGSYDSGFGPGGVGYVRFDRFEADGWPHNSFLYDMLRMQDGRVLFIGQPTASGAIIVAALKPDGSALDPGVAAGDGFFTFMYGGADSTGRVILQQPDGKILIVGATTGPNGNDDMAVQRFLPDFSVDSSFGMDGYQTVAFDLGGPSGVNGDTPIGAALQADGSIVLAGFASTTSNNTGELGIARLLQNGQLDPTFGPNHDGRVHLAADVITIAKAVQVDAQGRIVVVGAAVSAGNSIRCLINRLLPDGSQDLAFNASSGPGSGHAQLFAIPVSGVDRSCGLADVTVQRDGTVLATGSVLRDAAGATTYFAVVRLLPSGALDPSFGASGKSFGTFAPPASPSSIDDAIAVAVGNGGLMIGGSSTNAAGTDVKFGISRLTLDKIYVGGFEN